LQKLQLPITGERRGTEVPDRSGINGPWPPVWTSHDSWRQASGASHNTGHPISTDPYSSGV